MSHPDGRSRCRTLLVTVTEADEFADGKLEKHGSNEPLQPDGPEGTNADETRTLVVQVESGTVSTCTEEETDHGALTYVGVASVGAAKRGWLAETARPRLNFLT